MNDKVWGFVHLYENCVWDYDSLRVWRSNDYRVIVVLLQDHSSPTLIHSYAWMTMNMVSFLCWLKWYSHEYTIRCERFTHILMILRLKGHFHLMNIWAIMMLCWFECLVHSFMNMNLSKDLLWTLKGTLPSTEWIWKWDGIFYVRKFGCPK